MAERKSSVKKGSAKAKAKSPKGLKTARRAAEKTAVARPGGRLEKSGRAAKVKVSLNSVVGPATLSPVIESEPVEVGGEATKARRLSKTQLLELERVSRLAKKWEALQKKTKGARAEVYNMRKTFEARTPIEHKVLGWGFILDNKNDRLEVLFRDGIRYLISNYKS